MHEWIDNHRTEIIQTLSTLISIPSVMGEPSDKAPFGKEVASALAYALNVAESLGLRTSNMDGYIGFAEAGGGKELLGVLCHIDVVPAGAGWKHEPFGAMLDDGKIFGRGAMDDKGPLAAAMFALAAVNASALNFKRRARLLVGCNEEGGWGCIDYYKAHGEHPALAFSPDAEYPLVNSEKGLLHAVYEKKFASKLRINAGTRSNVVPGTAEAFVPVAAGGIDVKKCVLPCRVTEADGGCIVTVTGLAAHASTPEKGKNAIQAMLGLLGSLGLYGEDGATVSALNSMLGNDMHGERLGMDYEDASGRFTLNPAVLEWDGTGICRFEFDLRCPNTKTCDANLDTLSAAFEKHGFSLLVSHCQEAHHVDENSELVLKLLDVYAKNTGEAFPRPRSIGGGTYARAFKNAVAFGCERDGTDNRIHMPDEFISVDDLMLDTHMMADAIARLACE